MTLIGKTFIIIYMKISDFFKNINYQYLIAGLVFAILYMIWYNLIRPKKIRKEILAKFDRLASYNGYELKESKNKKYDYEMLASSNSKYKKILIKVIEVPKVSSITINSKNTWNLQYGGSGEIGKGFLYQRYLNELIPFLNLDVEKDELKLIVVFKSTLKIQRYLNESEIEIIKYQDKIYDYKVITFVDIEAHFADL